VYSSGWLSEVDEGVEEIVPGCDEGQDGHEELAEQEDRERRAEEGRHRQGQEGIDPTQLAEKDEGGDDGDR
jgi:hypothetical protein